jgi:hypothetical protein
MCDTPCEPHLATERKRGPPQGGTGCARRGADEAIERRRYFVQVENIAAKAQGQNLAGRQLNSLASLMPGRAERDEAGD